MVVVAITEFFVDLGIPIVHIVTAILFISPHHHNALNVSTGTCCYGNGLLYCHDISL